MITIRLLAVTLILVFSFMSNSHAGDEEVMAKVETAFDSSKDKSDLFCQNHSNADNDHS